MENNILGIGRTISSQRAHQKTLKEWARPNGNEVVPACQKLNKSKADPHNTKGWRPAIPTQTFFERLEGENRHKVSGAVENNPLFLRSFTWLPSISQVRKGKHLVLSLSRSMTRQEGSGQGPAAAPFGNDSVTRSKGRFSLFHQLDLKRHLTS